MGPRHFFESLPSTQTKALELARAGAPIGTRVVAREQVDGRGRADHRWESPPGGLYLSVVLAEPSRDASIFPLALAAELRGWLAREHSVPVLLKWPNDLLVERPGARPAKLAGLLIDRLALPPASHRIIAGIGLNVRQDPAAFPAGVRGRVATLEALVGHPVDLEGLERTVADLAESTVERLSAPKGAQQLLNDCRAALYGVGHDVLLDGEPAGRLVGLSDSGALELRTGTSLRTIWSGSLEVVEAA